MPESKVILPPGTEQHGETLPVDVADALGMERHAGELVVRDPSDKHEVVTVLDRHDEDLIILELQKRMLDVMMYEVPVSGGKKSVDLSVQGVDEAVRQIANIGGQTITIKEGTLEVESVTEDGQEWYIATVFAENATTGVGQYGSSAVSKRMKLTEAKQRQYKEVGKVVADDGTIWNPFARVVAIRKAQRNALKSHIPERLRQVMIAQFKGADDSIRRIKAGAGAEGMAELPPPLTDQRAEDLRAEARSLYSEISDISRTKYMVPGAFDASLNRAEWSHERLEEFIARLEGLLERANIDKLKAEQLREQHAKHGNPKAKGWKPTEGCPECERIASR